MLIYLDHAVRDVKAECDAQERAFTKADLNRAIMLGAVERVRPKMMTVVAIMAGLLPILWSTGTGSEVMQRIAVPMIGGMVSSTVLTLIVIPAVYALIKGVGRVRRIRTRSPQRRWERPMISNPVRRFRKSIKRLSDKTHDKTKKLGPAFDSIKSG